MQYGAVYCSILFHKLHPKAFFNTLGDTHFVSRKTLQLLVDSVISGFRHWLLLQPSSKTKNDGTVFI